MLIKKHQHLILISAGRAIQMLLMFFTYRLLSKFFSVEDMGGYYFLLSLAGAYGLIFANPLGMYANRKVHEWKNAGILNRCLKNLMLAYGVGSIFTIPFLFLFKEKLTNVNLSLGNVVAILIFYIFSNTIQSTFIPLLNLLGESTHFVIWTLITSFIGIILSVGLVKLLAPDPMFWLFGQSLSFAFFAFIGFLLIKKKFPDRGQWELPKENLDLKSIFNFALPIVFTNIFVWSMAQSFRFFLKNNVNPTILGEMTFGLGMATSISVAVEYLFQQLFFPNFYKEMSVDKHSRAEAWNHLFNKLAPAYIVLSMYLIGISPFMMRVLADIKFINAGKFLALGALIEFLRMTASLFNLAMHAEMKTNKAFVPYFVGGGLTLLGVIYISIHPQLVGLTPLVLGGGYFISMIFLFKSSKRIMKIKIDFKMLTRFIFISLIFLIPLFFKSLNQSLFISIEFCFVFGVFLLYLFYRQYKINDGART